MFKASYIGTFGKLATPPGSHVLTDQICLSFFCRRSSDDHCYQIILNSDHLFQRRIFKGFIITISHVPWRPCFGWSNFFLLFCRGCPKYHSCEAWLKLAQWYRSSCHLKQIVDDAGH